jgi:hypothetical protein
MSEMAEEPDESSPWVRLWQERQAEALAAAEQAARELGENNPWVRLWRTRRAARQRDWLEAQTDQIYWDSKQGCAASFAGTEFIETYCVMDEFCPNYGAGCLDAWLFQHGGNL